MTRRQQRQPRCAEHRTTRRRKDVARQILLRSGRKLFDIMSKPIGIHNRYVQITRSISAS